MNYFLLNLVFRLIEMGDIDMQITDRVTWATQAPLILKQFTLFEKNNEITCLSGSFPMEQPSTNHA